MHHRVGLQGSIYPPPPPAAILTLVQEHTGSPTHQQRRPRARSLVRGGRSESSMEGRGEVNLQHTSSRVREVRSSNRRPVHPPLLLLLTVVHLNGPSRGGRGGALVEGRGGACRWETNTGQPEIAAKETNHRDHHLPHAGPPPHPRSSRRRSGQPSRPRGGRLLHPHAAGA
jgi:hypothetical protein